MHLPLFQSLCLASPAQEEELEASDDASDFLSGLATASFVES
eukprot:COSAG03_NODE_22978_length_284_cov_1.410811_1_plen_41_part_01